ncbi:hypothetical protein D1007_01160 [Hordeum vulgare]|uniref:Uncharacterized protein n=1 Tax=Hordeum vulgare subsp. vulgare TaxID=112509 RepID=A0A8I6XNB0_HORVV|nr:uncharacterized protein LOC123395953 [Hordeum vulgare subsp. vulgare]KAE8820847.1 hypothetical protein D1007_01160 [Hordeum vulgare]KAI4964812.1 hypothetical protein ZWY2020_059515 [Hordeum vulgare]KAI4990588.1 hypothetical protein ZWY2020_038951 [Hordeum vulgare]
MGNLASQCVTGGAERGSPLVVLPDGSQFRLEEHAGVAELMIEAPGHVVARASDAAKERRLRALAADEFLRAGEVYLLVPAGRAGARLGDQEAEAISRLLLSGKKGGNGGRSGRRIFPEGEAASTEGGKESAGCAGKQALVCRIRPRQWRPALDTILEA